MPGRFAFLLGVLAVSMFARGQDGTVERGWTDKNNAEMHAAYMIQIAYNEQGCWGAKVEVKQSGNKRVFVVEPGPVYHIERFDVSQLRDLPRDAMTNSPKAGNVYSPDRINQWIATIENKYGRRVNWSSNFDRARAQVTVQVNQRWGGDR